MMFVIDEIPYAERKKNKEKVPSNLVFRPKKLNEETLIISFRHTTGDMKNENFKEFIIFQIKHSPDRSEILKYLEFNYLADLKLQIYDYENSGRFKDMKGFWLNSIAHRAKYRIEILERILENPPKPKKQIQEVTALTWINKRDHIELNKIYDQLSDSFINCTRPQFKSIFSGKKDFFKMKWQGSSTSLVYFYGRLIDEGKIVKPTHQWVKFKEFFKDSKPDLTKNPSRLYSRIKTGAQLFPEKSFFDSLIK